jgi:hypothetical protein
VQLGSLIQSEPGGNGQVPSAAQDVVRGLVRTNHERALCGSIDIPCPDVVW